MQYPSDLSDEQWGRISHIFEKKSRGLKPKYSKRAYLNALLYLNKTGCHWRYLPKDYPPWKAVYKYFQRLSFKSVFEDTNTMLSIIVRANSGRSLRPSLLCIDSQSVKGDVNIEEKGFDGNKQVNGRKRHILTDVLGIIFCCLITSANTSDVAAGNILIKKSILENVRKILGDRAYEYLKLPDGIELEMASKPPSAKGFVPVKIRWVVERTFAWLSRQRRLAKEYEVKTYHEESMVYIGMLRIMLDKCDKALELYEEAA